MTAGIADPPNCKRSWFQFSLRTLMIGVTVVAVVCAVSAWATNQVAIVRDRRQFFKSSAASVREIWTHSGDLSRVRLWLGDRAFDRIILNDSASPDDFRHFQTAFPEAQVVRASESK
jgi:hypothetical protein